MSTWESAIRSAIKTAISAAQPTATVLEFWPQAQSQEDWESLLLSSGAVNCWAVFLSRLQPLDNEAPAASSGVVAEFGVWHFRDFAASPTSADSFGASVLAVRTALNALVAPVVRSEMIGFSMDSIDRVIINGSIVQVGQCSVRVRTWRT